MQIVLSKEDVDRIIESQRSYIQGKCSNQRNARINIVNDQIYYASEQTVDIRDVISNWFWNNFVQDSDDYNTDRNELIIHVNYLNYVEFNNPLIPKQIQDVIIEIKEREITEESEDEDDDSDETYEDDADDEENVCDCDRCNESRANHKDDDPEDIAGFANDSPQTKGCDNAEYREPTGFASI
jgi:hypothetical protein